MIKICSPQLGMSPNSSLGGEVHDYQLIKELCDQGNNVSVLLPKGRKYEHNKNLSVEYLPIKHIVPPHLFNILVLPYLFKKRKEGFDILRFHNPYFLSLAGYLLKKIYPNTKIVTTIHLKETRNDLHWILKKTINIYDHIFTVSDYLSGWVTKTYGYPSNKVTTIYNGVDEKLKIVPKSKSLTEKYNTKEKIVLLSMGAFIDRKNVLFLVDLFNILLKSYHNICLVICGKGYLRGKLIQKIKECSLQDKIFVEKAVFGEDKNTLFNLADIFLFPSKSEGFGIVAAEAMKVGKPVVGSDNSSIPEIIDDGHTGYLAKTNDIDDWADKLSKLIENRSLREKMGNNGFEKVKKEFSWDKVTERTLEVYKRLC